MARVQKQPGGCWLWTGSINKSGYGMIGRNLGHAPKVVQVHRLSWEMHRGPIPEGVCVLHRCDVRHCVNPDHLFLGTIQDNNRDRDQKGRHKPFKGETHPMAKLTALQVVEIKKLLAAGVRCTVIGRCFGVTRMTIQAIKSGRLWAD
jgi:hypothetical protein